MSVLEGVYKQSGQPDTYVPIQVDAAGAVATTGGSGGGGGVGASAAEIEAALTSTNIPTETLLGDIKTDIADSEVLLTGIKTGIEAFKTGEVVQAIPDYPTAGDLLAAYGNFSDVAAGDFVTRVETSNGQVITALSGGPLQTGESRITLDVPVKQPCALEIEASMIRAKQQFATITLFDDGGVPDVVPDPINILSIYQSSAVQGAAYNATAGTVVTLTLETPLPAPGSMGAVYLSDWVNLTGLVDSRLNYQNSCISWISGDRKTITFGYSDEGALPSLAIATINPVLGSAKINFYNNMGGSHHGFGFRFTGTTTTSASLISIFGGGDVQVSGSLVGDHRVTCGNTAPVYISGAMGNVEIKASSRYRLEGRPSECAFLDKAVDNIAVAYAPRAARTAVKPAMQADLRVRFRLVQPVGQTRPVAKIVNVTKAGSATWTVTTEDAHNLVTGNYVTIKGVISQTNFPSFSTPVAVTVTGANTFTLVSLTGTATGYGGSVILCNGGVDQPGIIGQAIISISNYSVNPTWLVATANTTVTGLAVGDYINLHGVRYDLTGADALVDGAWEVANVTSAQIILKPVIDIFGVRVSPTLPVISGTVAAGGSVILRTTLRSHDILLETWNENKIMIDGQGSGRPDKALPVVLTTNPIVTQGSPAAPNATTGDGAWYIRPVIIGLPDITSTAITATSTGSSISNDKGNGFQIVVPVTTVTGTLPTMDVRVQESFDGGTTWETLYDFQRITAVGVYQSPILRATGRHVRYVRTIGGTSPSFTTSLTRVLLPFIPAEPQKRLIDRSVVLTTLNSATPPLFSGAANNVQLVVNIGTATTPPAIQLEGSEDAGLSWYAIGSPLTAVASGTVQLTVNNLSATHVRARVSTAGVTVVAGYVSVKAWS